MSHLIGPRTVQKEQQFCLFFGIFPSCGVPSGRVSSPANSTFNEKFIEQYHDFMTSDQPPRPHVPREQCGTNVYYTETLFSLNLKIYIYEFQIKISCSEDPLAIIVKIFDFMFTFKLFAVQCSLKNINDSVFTIQTSCINIVQYFAYKL